MLDIKFIKKIYEKEILEYLFEKCDVFSFSLNNNFGQNTDDTDDIEKIFSKHIIKIQKYSYVCHDELNNYIFEKYNYDSSKVDKIYEEIENIKLNKNYKSEIIKNRKNIYYCKLNEETRKLFTIYKNIIKIDGFNNLEDVCFYSKNNLIFKAVTHENLSFMLCKDKLEQEKLETMGIFGELYADRLAEEISDNKSANGDSKKYEKEIFDIFRNFLVKKVDEILFHNNKKKTIYYYENNDNLKKYLSDYKIDFVIDDNMIIIEV